MSRALNWILAALGIALVLATGGVAVLSDKAASAGQSASASPSGNPAIKTNRVKITDFKYKPPAVEVKVGSKLTFVNEDNAAHTGTSKTPGAFDSGSIRRGQTKSVVLKESGDFDYYCAFHPFMKAKIRVVG